MTGSKVQRVHPMRIDNSIVTDKSNRYHQHTRCQIPSFTPFNPALFNASISTTFIASLPLDTNCFPPIYSLSILSPASFAAFLATGPMMKNISNETTWMYTMVRAKKMAAILRNSLMILIRASRSKVWQTSLT